MSEALYRKYRPQTFEEVVGQEHIERTLRNAIQSDKVSHAYLFTGPRGTGKTTTARLLAKALLCQKGPTPEPDGTCEDCRLIAAGEHPDVYELDAASRTGVENVREEIISRVNYAPTRGRYKVYIIDEVHMLSVAAFNALLKTLEEPPAHVVFILCTTDPQKVPETIHSRCQRFDFRRISSEELISRLGAICELEGVQFEGDALDLIAHRAQGGMRDALTSLEQLIAFGDGTITSLEAERLLGSLDSSDLADIVRAIGTRNAAACFKWTSEYMETGADLAQFTKDLAEHVRDMYVMSLAGADVALEVTEAGRRELEAELEWFGPDRLSRMLGVLGDLISDLKTSTNQRLSFEIALTRMIRPDSDLTLESLAERIESLERSGVAAPQMVAPSPRTAVSAEIPGQSLDASGADVSATPDVSASACAQRAASAEGAALAHGGLAHGGEGAGGQVTREPVGVESDSAGRAASSSDARRATEGVSADAHVSADAAAHPAARQADPAVNVGDMRSVWNGVITNLKKIAEPYGVIFMNTQAHMDGASGKLIIEFNPGNEFAFNASKKPEIRKALADSLAVVGLAGIAYDIVKSGQATSTSEAPERATASDTPSPSPSQTEAEARSEAQAQSDARSDMQPGTQRAPESEMPTQQEPQPEPEPEPEPEPQSRAIPEPEQRPEPQPESQPHPRSDAVSQPQPEPYAQPGSEQQTHADQQAVRSDETHDEQAQQPSEESILGDMLASAFGEGIVLEEVE